MLRIGKEHAWKACARKGLWVRVPLSPLEIGNELNIQIMLWRKSPKRWAL